MSSTTLRRRRTRPIALNRLAVVMATLSLVASAAAASATGASATVAAAGRGPVLSSPQLSNPVLSSPAHPTLPVTYRGYRIRVPAQWRVVDLAARPHACVRFDRPAVYLGHPGDQSACPSHLVGGAPGMVLEALDAHSAPEVTRSTLPASVNGDVPGVRLPNSGPVSIAVEGAGVLVSAVYGQRSASAMRSVFAAGRILATAHQTRLGSLAPAATAAATGVNAPGDFLGQGFDACTAPSQAAMDAWKASSAYASIGVYIGGVSRGCAQPNLTASWVSEQAGQGWHVVPTYVGLQAPCTSFYNRMSYDAQTARAQGRAEAADAVTRADALGIAAPSTVYSDIEAYNNTDTSCVGAVLSYVSGWTRGLHAHGYEAGVYSSAASGMRDLSGSYHSRTYNRPDDIWLAWWNSVADVDGGGYVGDAQWSRHQRIHQYVGDVLQTYGGYPIRIDRDFLDVSAAVPPPRGCPTNVSFTSYPVLRAGDVGDQVRAAQCQLARRGFDPGTASGTIGWRTGASISAFNSSRGLLDRPVLGRRTWTALLAGGATRVLQSGSTGAMVSKLQRSLTASLRRTVPVDATFDRDTRLAVLDYQRAHGLVTDGTVGKQTWRALQAGL